MKVRNETGLGNKQKRKELGNSEIGSENKQEEKMRKEIVRLEL